MAGHIRTKQSCPKCGGIFGKDLVCPTCQTRPTRYFIDLWWQGRLKIYSDPQGYPLDSLARTEQLLSTIRRYGKLVTEALRDVVEDDNRNELAR